MAKRIVYLINTLIMVFIFESLAMAQINKIEVAVRYMNSLNYNIHYFSFNDSRYGSSEFLPVKIIYNQMDTSYNVLKSSIIDTELNSEFWNEKTLFYFVPPKKELRSSIEFYSSGNKLDVKETKQDFYHSNFDNQGDIQLQMIKLKEKFNEFEALKRADYNYEPGYGFLTTALFGYLSYRGFSKANKGEEVVLNTVLGVGSAFFVVGTFTVEIKNIRTHRKRKKRMKVLKSEFLSY